MSESKEKDSWSAKEYNDTAHFVYSSQYTSKVLTLLHAEPGERIIDFGCGSGEVSLEIERQIGVGAVSGSAGYLLAVDSSESMVSQAKANGLKEAEVGDIQNIVLDKQKEHSFDAVFSNAAIHWCKEDPEGVIRSANRCLKKGGRFVAEMGGFGNTIGVRSALCHVVNSRGYDASKLSPWFFPSVQYYKVLLEKERFQVEHIELEPRLTPLPGPLVDWLRLFCKKSWFKDFADEEAEEIMAEVQRICKVDCCNEEGNWSIMYCRLRFKATKLQ